MRISFAHLADYGSITQTGTANILGIFEVVNAFGMPCIQPRMVLAIGLEVDETDEGHRRVVLASLIDPEGRELRWTQLDIGIEKFDPLQRTHKAMLPFDVVQFNEFGTHRIRLSIDGQHQQDIEFQVALQEPGNGQGT